MSTKTHTKTLQVRIKDRHAAQLRQMARSVNFVWNYVNELSSRSIRERGVFLSNYDIHKYVNGAGKMLCPANSKDCRCGNFCVTSINTTPRNPVSHAKQIKRVVDNCRFKPTNKEGDK